MELGLRVVFHKALQTPHSLLRVRGVCCHQELWALLRKRGLVPLLRDQDLSGAGNCPAEALGRLGVCTRHSQSLPKRHFHPS